MTTMHLEQRGGGAHPLPSMDAERDRARRRLEAKRKLFFDLISYVLINAFLIGAWAVTSGGYFWPGWVLAGWGVALALHAWDLYWRGPISEADIDAEMRRQ